MRNNKNNNYNIDIVEELIYMSDKQRHHFINFYRYLSSEVVFMEYHNYLPNQFYLTTEDYDCFLFYRDNDNDQLRCYYDLQMETIDYDHLLYLYNNYNDMGILITNSNYNFIGIEQVKNLAEGDEVDYNLIDCIKWLLVLGDIQLEDIELIGCDEYTKNIYNNYFNNKEYKNV